MGGSDVKSSSDLPASAPGGSHPPERVACTRVRVRYADTDRMGVAYYSNYLVWFEVGRTEWLRQAGFTYREFEEAGIILPVIEAHCEYRQPARYDDELEIRTRGILLSPVRVEFDYEIAFQHAATVAAFGRTVHAAVDRTGRPTRLPGRVKDLFA